MKQNGVFTAVSIIFISIFSFSFTTSATLWSYTNQASKFETEIRGLILDISLIQKLEENEFEKINFQNTQSKLVDVCEKYEKFNTFVVSKFFIEMVGFPSKDVQRICHSATKSTTV